MKNLCLAGGVALNCVGNGRILREGPFERLWIQPAAGDAGGGPGRGPVHLAPAAGPAAAAAARPTAQQGSLLGPASPTSRSARCSTAEGAVYRYFADEDALCRYVAELIAAEKVVGWLQGRMEFGPRALGSRSILGDARSPAMQSVMNLKIKFRESFRPFAPVVLRERAGEYFEMPGGEESPYMLLVAPVRPSKARWPRRRPGRGPGQAQDASAPRSRRSRTSTTRPGCRRSMPSGTAGSTGC